MSDQLNRRDFIKRAAVTGASLSVLPVSADLLATPDGAGGKPPAAAPGAKSRIVEVHAPGSMINPRTPDDDRVREMVEKGIMELTQKKTLKEAWACFVKPDDVVGLKPNAAGMKIMGTHRAILEAVIDGVRSVGVPDENILVWEQVEEYLRKFYLDKIGVTLQPEEGGLHYAACTPALRQEHYMEGKPLPGYDTDPIEFPWGKIKLAELVTNKLTAIINLPVLKDHACAGVTLALKNISHAVIDTPWLCHDNCCDPHIADIMGIPALRNKIKLHILDALQGLADGGPQVGRMDMLFECDKILLSTDPVAIDALGHEWIAKAREEKKLVPLAEAENRLTQAPGRAATHIATAATRGLGTNDTAMMDLVKIAFDKPDWLKEREALDEEG